MEIRERDAYLRPRTAEEPIKANRNPTNRVCFQAVGPRQVTHAARHAAAPSTEKPVGNVVGPAAAKGLGCSTLFTAAQRALLAPLHTPVVQTSHVPMSTDSTLEVG